VFGIPQLQDSRAVGLASADIGDQRTLLTPCGRGARPPAGRSSLIGRLSDQQAPEITAESGSAETPPILRGGGSFCFWLFALPELIPFLVRGYLMSDDQKKRYDPEVVARTMAALTGLQDAPAPVKPVPKIDALKVVELALATLGSSGATWHQDGPFRNVTTKIDGDSWMTFQEPFTGATFGPDYRLQIVEGRETVLSVKWYSEDDEGSDRLVYCFQPGQWLASLVEMSKDSDGEPGHFQRENP
jgi:hypothetical protein